jgi:hypothetical protein
VRASHLRDRTLDAPPIAGFVLAALLIALRRLARGFDFGLVAMGVVKTPRIIVNLIHVHGLSSSLKVDHSFPSMRQNEGEIFGRKCSSGGRAAGAFC